MRYGDPDAQRRRIQARQRAAEQRLVDRLVVAKAAYRANPTPLTRARKVAAIDAVQRFRARVRANRPYNPRGGTVGGDAFLSPGQNGG